MGKCTGDLIYIILVLIVSGGLFGVGVWSIYNNIIPPSHAPYTVSTCRTLGTDVTELSQGLKCFQWHVDVKDMQEHKRYLTYDSSVKNEQHCMFDPQKEYKYKGKTIKSEDLVDIMLQQYGRVGSTFTCYTRSKPDLVVLQHSPTGYRVNTLGLVLGIIGVLMGGIPVYCLFSLCCNDMWKWLQVKLRHSIATKLSSIGAKLSNLWGIFCQTVSGALIVVKEHVSNWMGKIRRKFGSGSYVDKDDIRKVVIDKPISQLMGSNNISYSGQGHTNTGEKRQVGGNVNGKGQTETGEKGQIGVNVNALGQAETGEQGQVGGNVNGKGQKETENKGQVTVNVNGNGQKGTGEKGQVGVNVNVQEHKETGEKRQVGVNVNGKGQKETGEKGHVDVNTLGMIDSNLQGQQNGEKHNQKEAFK